MRRPLTPRRSPDSAERHGRILKAGRGVAASADPVMLLPAALATACDAAVKVVKRLAHVRRRHKPTIAAPLVVAQFSQVSELLP
jgi:hypothetical protein